MDAHVFHRVRILNISTASLFIFLLLDLEIADFTLTECIDEIMDFIFIKMGDIEPKEVEETEVEEEDLQKELEEHLEINSVE